MTTQLLTRHGQRPHPVQPLLGRLGLARARVHEFCGPARRTLAAMLMRETQGPVIWVQPGWQPERLFPEGLLEFCDPGRLILAQARRPEDILWTTEEALRSGAVGLVFAILPGLPGLTAVRRLHLAAQTGADEGRIPPLGVLLTAQDGGAQGVESRWHIAPRHGPGLTRWRLERRRARSDPPACWTIEREPQGKLRLSDGAPPPGAYTAPPDQKETPPGTAENTAGTDRA